MDQETKANIRIFLIFIIVAGLIVFGLYQHKKSEHGLKNDTNTHIKK